MTHIRVVGTTNRALGSRSVAIEYVSALFRRWWWIVATVAFSGGYDVVKYVAESAGYQLVLPRWIGYALGAGALFVAQFFAFADMRRERDEARAAFGSKRPRVVPEIVYTPVGNVGQERVTLHVTNVGETALRELAIQPIGSEGHARVTFDLVQLLRDGESAAVRVRFGGGVHTLVELLAHVFMVKFVGAQRHGNRLAKRDAHIPLVLSYRDVTSGEEFRENFCFDFAEPSSGIPSEGRWFVRAHEQHEREMTTTPSTA
jgi:hypothetical protein